MNEASKYGHKHTRTHKEHHIARTIYISAEVWTSCVRSGTGATGGGGEEGVALTKRQVTCISSSEAQSRRPHSQHYKTTTQGTLLVERDLGDIAV